MTRWIPMQYFRLSLWDIFMFKGVPGDVDYGFFREHFLANKKHGWRRVYTQLCSRMRKEVICAYTLVTLSGRLQGRAATWSGLNFKKA